MNRFLKFFYFVFGKEQDELLDESTAYVYVDVDDECLVREGSPMREITKTEVLRRFKSIYKKRKIQRKIFGYVIYNKIYLVEVKKVKFLDLKDSFISFKNKQQVHYEQNVSLIFEPISLKPNENPY